MYIAIHYVRVNGKMFTPGEIITEKIAPEKAERMSRLGAVRAADTACDREESADRVTDEQNKNCEEATEAALDETDADDEDAPTPEIDVTAGIVPAETPREKARGRKKA